MLGQSSKNTYILLLLSGLLLSGCGQYGDLYMPAEKQAEEPAVTATNMPETATPAEDRNIE